MKKYSVDEALKAIEKQIEAYRKDALKITDENGLLIAYKIMNSNPRSYYYLDKFEENDNLITSLKVIQVLTVLDLVEIDDETIVDGDKAMFWKEAIIKYTQLLYCKNTIEELQKEYKKEKYFDTSILMEDFEEIEELTPQVANRYYIRPVYFEVYYKDEDERTVQKIMAETYSYHYCVLSDEELEEARSTLQRITDLSSKVQNLINQINDNTIKVTEDIKAM